MTLDFQISFGWHGHVRKLESFISERVIVFALKGSKFNENSYLVDFQKQVLCILGWQNIERPRSQPLNK